MNAAQKRAELRALRAAEPRVPKRDRDAPMLRLLDQAAREGKALVTHRGNRQTYRKARTLGYLNERGALTHGGLAFLYLSIPKGDL